MTLDYPAAPFFVAQGLEFHGPRIRTGLGLAIADGELNLGANNLRQEAGLRLLVAVSDDGLAHDAHALSGLGGR
jgi:hypothetical protein